MKLPLKNIVSLRFGLYEKPMNKGEVRYLQAKDYDESGKWSEETDTWIDGGKKTRKHLLQSGEILFAGKGYRNFAWVYSDKIGPAVASSMFFVLTPDQEKVRPEFLAIILNTDRYQALFYTLGGGTSTPSIRKKELGAVEISLPSLQEQDKIVTIGRLHKKSAHLRKLINEEREKLYNSVIHKLIKSYGK